MTGTTGDGIAGRNGYYGTNLSVTAESTVSGGDEGIYAYNIGTGALSITANGAVTGTTGGGILAINKASGLSLTAESTVSGATPVSSPTTFTAARWRSQRRER
ncbi:MAG: hypothetical protein JKP98_04230 [Rhodobacteraceae bacterium]|nr:hypothetical protein [Paracoccaceae bacterium]